ncbi:MAG: alpha-2-macroglobulin family protein, partial [Burkholderiaceae bacterium]|nr:alpha-2-macroglobulin family protein [Burkholderiaceae bacterium]
MAKGKGLGLTLVVAGLVASAAALGWWAGSSSGHSSDSKVNETAASGQAAISASTGDHAELPTPIAGDSPPAADAPFKPLHCQARQFNGTLALAVTFGQPIDRSADLLKWIRVQDAGRLDDENADPDRPAQAVAAKAGEWPARLRDASRPVNGSWVVGEDARTVYFPYVGTLRRYVVRFDAGIPGAKGNTATAELAHCDVKTDVMPQAFYFASRGVVLPAGQNGGLPVATVNVAEVDVQFLRVDPAQVPQFFDKTLGLGKIELDDDAATSNEDSDADASVDDEWQYADNRAVQGLVGLWDLDRLRKVSRSVFQGRFVTAGAPDQRNVTFLPVEDIEALRAPGIYVAVMSQPGRFAYESQVTYFYVSDIGLHARRYADSIDAFAVSLTSGQPQDNVDISLVDTNGRTLVQARADAQGRARFTDVPAEARVLRAVRGNEMTVLALGEPALDLSEFDVSGLSPSKRKLFAYAGRNLYRPGETFTVSVLARDPDGRTPERLAPVTATVKRADGRTVSTAFWTPHAKAPGYTEHALALPADAQTGAWRLELRADPGQRQPDAVWPFQVEEFLPERMKLTLSAPDIPPQPGQKLDVAVQGDYL